MALQHQFKSGPSPRIAKACSLVTQHNAVTMFCRPAFVRVVNRNPLQGLTPLYVSKHFDTPGGHKDAAFSNGICFVSAAVQRRANNPGVQLGREVTACSCVAKHSNP